MSTDLNRLWWFQFKEVRAWLEETKAKELVHLERTDLIPYLRWIGYVHFRWWSTTADHFTGRLLNYVVSRPAEVSGYVRLFLFPRCLPRPAPAIRWRKNCWFAQHNFTLKCLNSSGIRECRVVTTSYVIIFLCFFSTPFGTDLWQRTFAHNEFRVASIGARKCWTLGTH